jgi:hypothetical protein
MAIFLIVENPDKSRDQAERVFARVQNTGLFPRRAPLEARTSAGSRVDGDVTALTESRCGVLAATHSEELHTGLRRKANSHAHPDPPTCSPGSPGSATRSKPRKSAASSWTLSEAATILSGETGSGRPRLVANLERRGRLGCCRDERRRRTAEAASVSGPGGAQ